MKKLSAATIQHAFTAVKAAATMKARPVPFPDYGRSLVTQMETNPMSAGLLRGAGSGVAGAVLGALIGTLLKNDPKYIAGGAAAGGLAGAIPGFLSGAQESESDKTKLLALRRMGLQTPGELEFAERFPNLIQRLSSEGYHL
jgi:hypothetical protein